MSCGTNGTGTERYLAYLPFQVAPGASLAPAAFARQGGGQVRLEHLTAVYALVSGPFQTDGEARSQLDELRAIVCWLALEFRIGTKPATQLGKVTLWDQPMPVAGTSLSGLAAAKGWDHTDGHYEAELAQVLPDHKRLVRYEIGSASVTVGISAANGAAAIGAALSYPRIGNAARAERLKLAIDLYAESRALVIPRAQFLTLVIALEALLPDEQIGVEAQNVLTQLKGSARVARDAAQMDSPIWRELDHLLSRVGHLKRQSIGTSLKHFIETSASKRPELGEVRELTAKMKRIYEVRSNLVHEGTADAVAVAEALSFLTTFVPRLLRTLFVEAAGPANT